MVWWPESLAFSQSPATEGHVWALIFRHVCILCAGLHVLIHLLFGHRDKTQQQQQQQYGKYGSSHVNMDGHVSVWAGRDSSIFFSLNK